ncbi:carboxypeptidase-like regulatory domain-containing protein [Limibacter armeniacum]|uniref:carboxypeptidase-like regulatory domain-containing protein n=1 Tax=Limibacter armeniacum TaxID=466084 RepID=UPI002FE5A1EE
MRITLTFLCLLLMGVLSAFGQDRTLEGIMLDSNGEPMPGASLSIKGTNIGTVTDMEGHYKLTAPVGATIVVSLVGYKTREFVVPGNSPVEIVKPTVTTVKQKKTSVSPASSGKGIGVLDDSSPTYVPIDYYNIFNRYALSNYEVKYKQHKGKYTFKRKEEYTIPTLQYRLSTKVGWIGKAPKLQDSFAQGSPNEGSYQWKGGDQQEMFSWGPRVSQLRYDGSSYPYDVNGSLESVGTGGNAKTYDPYDLFKPSFSHRHYLALNGKAGILNYKSSYSHESIDGIIKPSERTNDNLSFDLGIRKRAFEADFNYYYGQKRDKWFPMNGNYQQLLFNLITTPPTFHNKDENVRSVQPYRTYAAGWSRNPYSMMEDDLSLQKYNSHMAGLGLSYHLEKWKFMLNSTYQRRWQDQRYDVNSFARTDDISRNLDFQYWNADGGISKEFTDYYREFHYETLLHYLFESSLRDYGVQNISESRAYSDYVERKSSSLKWGNELRWDYLDIQLSLGNTFYHSNTFSGGKWKPWAPYAKATIHPLYILDELAGLYVDPFSSPDFFEVSLGYYRSYQEWALEANPLYANSMTYSSQDWNTYYPTQEVGRANGLQPEQYGKFDLNFRSFVRLGAVSLTMEASNYHYQVENMLAPVVSEEQLLQYENVGAYQNKGWEVSLEFAGNFNYKENFKLKQKVSWERARTKVSEVYNPSGRQQLAGFTNIGKYIVEGQPLGVLVGTRFEKDAFGNLVIDSEGFTMESDQVGIIGDPNPDWVIQSATSLTYRKWQFNMIWDFKHGGDVWNGTRQMLDYLGRSASTGEQREVTGYVFDGVTQTGEPNQMAVDFADPANGLEGNRWVRYGPEGVGEAGIEDGSWVRLQSLSLGYSITNKSDDKLIRAWKVSVVGENLLLWTPYTGVDPQTSLLGQPSGMGIDYFNTPSMRTIQFKLSFTL